MEVTKWLLVLVGIGEDDTLKFGCEFFCDFSYKVPSSKFQSLRYVSCVLIISIFFAYVVSWNMLWCTLYT
jgi:hypothetical protein